MSQAHNLKGEKELFKLEFEIQKGKMLEFIIPFECYRCCFTDGITKIKRNLFISNGQIWHFFLPKDLLLKTFSIFEKDKFLLFVCTH